MRGRGREGKENHSLVETTNKMVGCSDVINWRGNYRTLWDSAEKRQRIKESIVHICMSWGSTLVICRAGKGES